MDAPNRQRGIKNTAEDDVLRSLLINCSKAMGIMLDENQTGMLLRFIDIIRLANQTTNLTAIEGGKDMVIKHLVDSLSIVPAIDEYIGSRPDIGIVKIADVGSGAGFPGIPVKIAGDGRYDMTLLDSLGKRVDFMKEAIGTLGLSGARALHGRAEEFGRKDGFREAFDITTARAVAGLPVLCEYCLPLTVVGGLFIAMKGATNGSGSGAGGEALNGDKAFTAGEALTGGRAFASERALSELGGMVEEIRQFEIPGTDMKRSLIIIRKCRQTPTKYPRKPGKPSKSPIA